MLDLLFLIGDPKKSTTLLDNPIIDGDYTVGEAIKTQDKLPKKAKATDEVETRVRIDRTSQLLIAMSITIAEKVKMWHLRSNQKDAEKDEKIRQLSGFEDIVNKNCSNKSAILTSLLSVEVYFFSKRNNEKMVEEQSMNIVAMYHRKQNNLQN